MFTPPMSAPEVSRSGVGRHEGNACPIGSLSDSLHATDGSVLFQHDGHRALIVRQPCAVRPVQAPGDAPLVSPQREAAACERNGGFIVEGDPPRSVGRVDGRGQGFDQVPEVPLAFAKRPIVFRDQPLQVRAERGQLVGPRQGRATQRAREGVPERHGRDRLLVLVPDEEGSA
jgi:hypothetical protein